MDEKISGTATCDQSNENIIRNIVQLTSATTRLRWNELQATAAWNPRMKGNDGVSQRQRGTVEKEDEPVNV